MLYYHDLVTESSWQTLTKLSQKYRFILIGGWAVYLYTRGLKSKDIDLVLDFGELDKLKQDWEVAKNERLKKYQTRKGEVEIDIYVPYYSNPGLPAQDLKKLSVTRSGFTLPKPEVLLILKQTAAIARQGTVKGRKDVLDIIGLLTSTEISWPNYHKLLTDFKKSELIDHLKELLQKTTQVPELELNSHRFSRLKKSCLEQLEKVS